MKQALIILGFYLISNNLLLAQDTHYWTNQYGTKSALLGGAVVGGIKNNTAIFYNPGALGFIDTASLSINANAYSSENIVVENALGQKQGFKSNYLGSIPLLVGGMFRSGKDQKLKIAYGIVAPIDFNFNATARLDNVENVANDEESPGSEEFIAQSSLNSKLKETVAAVGLGQRINDHWSIGISNFFSFRSLSYYRTQYARLFLNDEENTLVSASYVRTIEYFNVKYIAKIGLAYQKDNFSAGLTVTTPSINLFGNGKIAVDLIGNNLMSDGSRIDFLANDRQVKLKSKYKSPLSVSGGVNWSMKRSLIGVALQYYGKVDAYDVMQAKPSAFVRPASLYNELQSDQYLRVKASAKAVFNIALGYEYKLKDNLSLTGSFRTNNSYYDKSLKDEVGIKPEFTSWDIYHITGGFTLSKGQSQLSLGLLYAFGADNNREIDGNLDSPTEDNFLQGATTITKAKYSSVGLLFGYTFSFKKF